MWPVQCVAKTLKMAKKVLLPCVLDESSLSISSLPIGCMFGTVQTLNPAPVDRTSASACLYKTH